MASETEINACFNSIRAAMDIEAQKAQTTEDKRFFMLASAGVFLLENFLIDVHNIAVSQDSIADALDKIANCQDAIASEAEKENSPGWSTK